MPMMDILQNLNQKTYRLETIVYEQRNPFYTIQKSFTRNVEVYYLGKVKENYQFQIIVVDFIFSEEDAQSMLLKKLSYLFDELELTLNNEGKILSVDNILFLRMRWIAIQADLSKLHQGAAVDGYFREISSVLENEKRLINFLSGYSMLGLLFHQSLTIKEGKNISLYHDGYTEVATLVQKGEKTIVTITVANEEDSKTNYFGGILKCRNNRYEEGFIEIKKHHYHIKYSLLWIG